MNFTMTGPVKRSILLGGDLIIVAIAIFVALYLRLDVPQVSSYFDVVLRKYLLISLFCYGFAFVAFKTFRTIVRLANFHTAMRVSLASVAGALLFYIVSVQLLSLPPIPRSLFIIQFLIVSPLTIFFRFTFRIFERLNLIRNPNSLPTIIYGAGQNTNRLLPVIMRSLPDHDFVGIVDDDKAKHGCEVQGIRVLGSFESLSKIIVARKIEKVILSMPSLTGEEVRNIIRSLSQFEVSVQILPAPESFLSASNESVHLRNVEIEDLLRRTPRRLDFDEIRASLQGKAVLVTGGGGSIGSELVRQIARFEPSLLVINDASEFSLYQIFEQIIHDFPRLRVEAHLGSLAEKPIVSKLFKKYAIDVVFHASAYKHVPFGEENVGAMVRNNVLSARNVFEAARMQGVGKVVLISTDKAVRPTNVMGATKRLCELLAARSAQIDPSPGGTVFSSVRFGNVLGSSGSVVPKMVKQIRSGGPVTVTHPDITRYFMLIPEAVSLVLQAGTANESGVTYVLNMGPPVRILDMARDLIRLMGKREAKEIEIEFTGLRQGEKLYEELNLGSEKLEKVTEEFSKIASTISIHETFDSDIDRLLLLSNDDDCDEAKVRTLLFSIITSYESQDDASHSEPALTAPKSNQDAERASHEVIMVRESPGLRLSTGLPSPFGSH